MDWQIHLLTDSLTAWLNDWPTDWQARFMADRVDGYLTNWAWQGYNILIYCKLGWSIQILCNVFSRHAVNISCVSWILSWHIRLLLLFISSHANQEYKKPFYTRLYFNGTKSNRAYVAWIVLAKVFSMAWYKIVMKRSLVKYHGISHFSLVFF